MTKLTDTKIRALRPREKSYYSSDGRGLNIKVKPSGSKTWVHRYRVPGTGEATSSGLGSYPEVSLREARDAHQQERDLLRSGVNPTEHRRTQAQAIRHAVAHTFSGVAADWIAHHRQQQAETTRDKDRWVLKFANTAFGPKAVSGVTAGDLRSMLEPIRDAGKLETAHRVLRTCSQVFRYAIRSGLRESNPADTLKGWLPAAVVKSHAAVTEPADIGRLMRAIDGYAGMPTTVAALKLSALTFVRPGEIRHARWEEIDLGAAVWTIPGHRMKGPKRTAHLRPAHIVPLADQAVAILRELHALTGSRELVFPSRSNPRKPMSENTMTSALERMGFDGDAVSDHTAHGFRAMASTRLNEAGFDPDVIERQLSHREKDAVRAAYHRAAYLDERRKLMQWWADYLDRLRTGASVTDISQARPRFQSVG
jgi:integrase